MIYQIVSELIQAFPNSFINRHGEFIAHDKGNSYFILKTCKDEEEVKCKVLEWFSRDAFKSEPFCTDKKNDEYHKFMLNGINKFLGTSFTERDMPPIYCKLGNNVNRKLCIEFIRSGYNMNVLDSEVEE